MKKILSIFILAALFATTVQAQVQWRTIEQASQVDTKTNKKNFCITLGCLKKSCIFAALIFRK